MIMSEDRGCWDCVLSGRNLKITEEGISALGRWWNPETDSWEYAPPTGVIGVDWKIIYIALLIEKLVEVNPAVAGAVSVLECVLYPICGSVVIGGFCDPESTQFDSGK